MLDFKAQARRDLDAVFFTDFADTYEYTPLTRRTSPSVEVCMVVQESVIGAHAESSAAFSHSCIIHVSEMPLSLPLPGQDFQLRRKARDGTYSDGWRYRCTQTEDQQGVYLISALKYKSR